MSKWIYDYLGTTAMFFFDAAIEINIPIGIGRTNEWVIIPKDARYEGM